MKNYLLIHAICILSFLLCILSSCSVTGMPNTSSANSISSFNSDVDINNTKAEIETQQIYCNDQTYLLKIPNEEYVQEYGYPVNESGETYGPVVDNITEPDLTLATNPDGVIGYIRMSDLDAELPTSPEEAIGYNSSHIDQLDLYLEDGYTVIGSFPLAVN